MNNRVLGFAAVSIGAEYTPEELEFMQAISEYRKATRRRFPSCTEVLAVAKSLGYRKVADAISVEQLVQERKRGVRSTDSPGTSVTTQESAS